MAHPVAGWFFLHRHITGIICAVIVLTAIIFALMSIRYPDIFRIEVIIWSPQPSDSQAPGLDPPPVRPLVTPPDYIPPAPEPDEFHYEEE